MNRITAVCSFGYVVDLGTHILVKVYLAHEYSLDIFWELSFLLDVIFFLQN